MICITIHYTQQFISRRDLRDHLISPVLRFSFCTIYEERIWQINNKRLKDDFFSIVFIYKPYTDYKLVLSSTWNRPSDIVWFTQNWEVSLNLILALPCLLSIHICFCMGQVLEGSIAGSKGSLNRACKGAGWVKGTYKWWCDTRGLSAIGNCFVTTCCFEVRKGAIPRTQDEL